jgi:hypothetical protein
MRRWLLCVVVILLIAVTGPLALAQSEPLQIPWHVIQGGGASAAGEFALSGTVGQPGVGPLSGGDYALQGGFWGVAPAALWPGETWIYLPLVQRQG